GLARWSVSQSDQKAAIPSHNLCTLPECGPGQYRASYYLDSTSVCSMPAGAAAALTISWKDETSQRSIRVPLSGSGVAGGNSLALGATSNFGGGNISLWSAG